MFSGIIIPLIVGNIIVSIVLLTEFKPARGFSLEFFAISSALKEHSSKSIYLRFENLFKCSNTGFPIVTPSAVLNLIFSTSVR